MSRRSQSNKGYGAPPSLPRPYPGRSAAYRVVTRGDLRATVIIWPRGSPICGIAWLQVYRRGVPLKGLVLVVVASATQGWWPPGSSWATLAIWYRTVRAKDMTIRRKREDVFLYCL
jgi:hypothetical protein